MTDDEIMRQLGRAVRDDDVLAAEEMVMVGQQEHPEWDWPFPATVLWIQRGQVQEGRPGNRPDGGGCAGWPMVAKGEDRARRQMKALRMAWWS